MNPYNMKKSELQIYLTGHCKHRMPYTQHPKCFEKEINKEMKIGILDIETAWGFKADAGFIICYVIKTLDKDEVHKACITHNNVKDYQNGLTMSIDQDVIKKLVEDMQRYDILITYNGSRFDIPYARTRALKHGYDFPKYGYVKHIDLFYTVKYKLKLSRSSLESATRFFGIKGKNHVDFTVWQKAAYGDTKSIGYIMDHCERDVIDCTEPLYKKLCDYMKRTSRSL